MQVRSLGWEDALEEKMAMRSGNIAWQSHEQRSLGGYSPQDHRVRQDRAHMRTLFDQKHYLIKNTEGEESHW